MSSYSAFRNTPNPWVNESAGTSLLDISVPTSPNPAVLNAYHASSIYKQLETLKKMNNISKEASGVVIDNCNLLCVAEEMEFHQSFEQNHILVKDSILKLETLMKNVSEVRLALNKPHVGPHMKIEAGKHVEIKELLKRMGKDLKKLSQQCETLSWHTDSDHNYRKENSSYLFKFCDPSVQYKEQLDALKDKLYAIEARHVPHSQERHNHVSKERGRQ